MTLWPTILLLASGCASRPIYVTPLPESQFSHMQRERQTLMRVKLDLFYQTEANKRRRAELLSQMSQSKTNYPPFRKSP